MSEKYSVVSKKKIVLISAGDPSSIASEVTIKALQSGKILDGIIPIVVTNSSLLKKHENIFQDNWKIYEIKDQNNFRDFKKNNFNIISLKIDNEIELGNPSIKNGCFIKSSIVKCVELESKTIASAIVTNPINKNIMYKSGFKYAGHTEFLATFSKKTIQPVMMLVSKDLKTVPLTIHVPLKEVPNLITKDLILSTVKITSKYLKKYFGINKPRIVITGLNPHSGENGDIGLEEKKIIIPCINDIRENSSILLDGPFSADTIFSYQQRQTYDVAICMYHDQALIPIKTLDFNNGINVTLGLDFIRTSPDHGTGFDIAGKDKADPGSLISAINLAYLMSVNKDNA
jgi:4-hydroxythreonine-4-phosphate dehydrogenase